MVFDRAYVQQGVCSPSRNSFLSGRRSVHVFPTVCARACVPFWTEISVFLRVPMPVKLPPKKGKLRRRMGCFVHPHIRHQKRGNADVRSMLMTSLHSKGLTQLRYGTLKALSATCLGSVDMHTGPPVSLRMWHSEGLWIGARITLSPLCAHLYVRISLCLCVCVCLCLCFCLCLCRYRCLYLCTHAHTHTNIVRS